MRDQALPRFYTIGHSTRPASAFADLLRSVGADMVVDVRAFPRSRKNPAYDHDVLPGFLAHLGIGYEHLPQLGGRRGRSAAVDPATNGFWENEAFHNYADHALGEDFAAGLDRLLGLGRRHIPALMCAEAVWWRCHRRIVADHLLHHGAEVYHVLSAGRVDPARLTPAARVREDGRLVYPPP